MDCRAFRENHVAYVDDVLSAVDMATMRAHVQRCAKCARHDTAVRRSLLLARNLPTLEPSPDFMARLQQRIHALESANPTGSHHRMKAPIAGFAALAAVIALVAYLALASTVNVGEPAVIRMAPVVATAPARPASPAESPAFVASVATGMSVWPAVLMLDEAPQQLMDVQLQQASLRR